MKTIQGLIVGLLLIGSAPLLAQLKDVDMQLILACREGDSVRAAHALDRGADVDAKFGTDTALLWATDLGHTPVVQLLLDRKAHIEARNGNGETPLIVAARNGNCMLTKMLLDAKANINAKDSLAGLTPLCCACQNGHTDVADLLLTYKPDLEATDKHGRTALVWAVGNGQTKIAKKLIAMKANVNARGQFGRTPLIWAVKAGNIALVELMLRNGVDIMAIDDARKTALDHAQAVAEDWRPYDLERWQEMTRIVAMLEKAKKERPMTPKFEQSSAAKSA